jgi:hypothetical protein
MPIPVRADDEVVRGGVLEDVEVVGDLFEVEEGSAGWGAYRGCPRRHTLVEENRRWEAGPVVAGGGLWVEEARGTRVELNDLESGADGARLSQSTR